MARRMYATKQVYRPKVIHSRRPPAPLLVIVFVTCSSILFFTMRFYALSKGSFVLLAVTPTLTSAAPETSKIKSKYFDIQVRETPVIQTELQDEITGTPWHSRRDGREHP